MVIITFLVLMAPVAFVAYWVGRGVKLNRQLKAAKVAAESAVHPEALVNLETGEVVEPTQRKYARAKRAVRFEP